MAMKKLFSLVMLIFMVSLVIEKDSMVKVVEAGDFCWRPSRLFHGVCLRNTNCAPICEQEGFVTGECKGMINRQCMCGADCGGGNPPPISEVPQPPPVKAAAAAKLRQKNTPL